MRPHRDTSTRSPERSSPGSAQLLEIGLQASQFLMGIPLLGPLTLYDLCRRTRDELLVSKLSLDALQEPAFLLDFLSNPFSFHFQLEPPGEPYEHFIPADDHRRTGAGLFDAAADVQIGHARQSLEVPPMGDQGVGKTRFTLRQVDDGLDLLRRRHAVLALYVAHP